MMKKDDDGDDDDDDGDDYDHDDYHGGQGSCDAQGDYHHDQIWGAGSRMQMSMIMTIIVVMMIVRCKSLCV